MAELHPHSGNDGALKGVGSIKQQGHGPLPLPPPADTDYCRSGMQDFLRESEVRVCAEKGGVECKTIVR